MMFNPLRIFAICFLATLGPARAITQSIDSISIEDCYSWAEANYPLIMQLDLIEKSSAFNINNVARSNLPRVEVKGQASYQSEVTQLPISLPNLEIPEISKDQYKLYVDVYQPLTNRSEVTSAKKKIKIGAEIEKQEVAIELYKLRDRINQVYFGVLLLDAQLSQLEIVSEDLSNAYSKTEAAVQNGVAIESNLDLIDAERIGIDQKILENQIAKQAFVQVLAALINRDVTSSTFFIRPFQLEQDEEITRPELRLFELKIEALDVEYDRVKARTSPEAGVFLQGGYGRPALNFLSNRFETYYLGGVRFKWNLSSLYTNKEERESLLIAKEMVNNSKETFLFGRDLLYKKQNGELRKYQELIAADQALIDLRRSIKETAEEQLRNGLITALDLIEFINAEGKARQDKVLHEVQLLRAQYELKFIIGE